ncbi:MAG: asparagine synthase (glutamine-hydrolyzing), partial [Synechococcaceae cyanobacterium]|nr:asparagine synthase (glutamine-hydrolyzing) [Synechococcaceae cyanobacterium]
MCGITGIVGTDAPDLLRLMTQMLVHRGPDDGAVWTMSGAGFGHRRLSILDLSEAGRQPMASEDGRHVLVFNGEIFNYTELRDELKGKGHAFRSRTDSEVLLRACIEWGEAVVDRLVGQFAFAFWDVAQRRLTLARDHLGIKPLYYAEQGGILYFASEAKAIAAVLPDTRALREDLLPQYLSFLWVPGEETLFRGIRKMLPGSIAVYENGVLRSRRYWDPVEKWTAAGPARPSPAERDEEFRMLLRRAVRSQLMSDVPLGLLLSGGIDSTILLAEMAGARETPRAFTAHYSSESRGRDVFEDDLPYARLAADEYGADLEVATLEDDAPQLLADAVWHCDEPLADPTIVTNLALTRRARQGLTVLL